MGAVSGIVCTWVQLALLHLLLHCVQGKIMYKAMWLSHCTDIMFVCINHVQAKPYNRDTHCRRTGHVWSLWGVPVLHFFPLSLLRSSRKASLQKCLQNLQSENGSHHFFLVLNTQASSSVYAKSGTTDLTMLPAVLVALGLPCFCWHLSEDLASVTSLSSASAE